MVILADVSGDEVLGRLIVDSAAGKDDIHLYVVRHAFTDIYPDAQYATVDKKKQHPYPLLRNAAKPTSYGIAYGITGMALSDTITKELASMGITCTVAQAQTILDNWKERAFPKAGKWLTNAGLDALQCGYAATRLGRKRFFDLEYARRYEWRQHAIQREASNSPIQGACADLMKLAMCYLYERIASTVGHDAAKIVLTVHDELLVEVDDLHVEQVSGMMKASMEEAAQALLPVMGHYVKVDVAVSQQYDK
jgi:DNA polymerase-1